MQAVAARGSAASYALARVWPKVAVPPLLCLLAIGARGQDLPGPEAGSAAASGRNAPSRLEFATSSLPLYESPDGASRTSRIDMVWLPPRQARLGLAVGLSSLHGAGLKLPGNSDAPAVDLGFHWRYALDRQYRVDVTAWRRMTPADAFAQVQTRQPGYGARVEMQIGSIPATGFVAERGFLGLQLESGARITVRKKEGRPMFYYRTRF